MCNTPNEVEDNATCFEAANIDTYFLKHATVMSAPRKNNGGRVVMNRSNKIKAVYKKGVAMEHMTWEDPVQDDWGNPFYKYWSMHFQS